MAAQVRARREADDAKERAHALPEAGLVQIAEGVRTRLVAEARESEAARQRVAERQRELVKFGMDYANRELRAADGLEAFERWRIEARVKEELRDVTGEESRVEIQGWVDEILEDEGLEPVDGD